ncbi:unnamed protein product, partial [Ectocarpus fasciculatus]
GYRVKYLTPFQGNRRVFGYFICRACNDKKWVSAGTWKNKWQKCKGCERELYPYQQHVLEKRDHVDDSEERRPHHMDRCEKCIEKGEICMPRYYFPA